jgi:tRNA(fMet)-specific endonuclease VapC
MAARYLLDSNTCIYALSGRHPEVARMIDRKLPGQVLVSVIAAGELMAGAAKSQNALAARRRIEALISVVPIAQLPAQAAEHYGEIRSALERAGTPIGGNDLWIAAHARAEGLVLVTNNEREFKRVKGLKIESWVK